MDAFSFSPVAYCECRDRIRSGDVLLWRPTTPIGRLICRGTRGQYSHAAMAGWWGDVLLAVEMLQFAGGCVGRLSQQVERWPGACDVYRPKRPYYNHAALHKMVQLVGQDYGWADFFHLLARRYSPIPHAPARNTNDPDTPRVCSSAVAWALRVGGRKDHGRRDLELTPNDLARFHWLEYQGTLVPEVTR